MLTDNLLLTKLQNYCAYQERSQYEVRQKLFEEKVYGDKAEQVIAILIGENFLNEERFAIAYSGGRFRIKHWGKIKIKMGLRAKQVPEKLIAKALGMINRDDYLETLKKVIEKKGMSLGEKNPLKRRRMFIAYALGRGFEQEDILTVLSGLSDIER